MLEGIYHTKICVVSVFQFSGSIYCFVLLVFLPRLFPLLFFLHDFSVL